MAALLLLVGLMAWLILTPIGIAVLAAMRIRSDLICGVLLALAALLGLAVLVDAWLYGRLQEVLGLEDDGFPGVLAKGAYSVQVAAMIWRQIRLSASSSASSTYMDLSFLEKSIAVAVWISLVLVLFALPAAMSFQQLPYRGL